MILVPYDIPRLFSSDSPNYRGSFFLCLGAVVMVLGGLASLLMRLPFPATESFLNPYFSWSLWIASLLFLGSGFLWVGSAPGFSRMGFLVALFHVAQAISLLMLIIPTGVGRFPPEFLTLGRLVSLLLFTFREKSVLPTPTLVLLGSTSALQILKINLRVLQLLPDGSSTWLILLDTALLLLMAVALFLLGVSLLKGDDSWSLQTESNLAMALEDFNNPEHPWNKKSNGE